MKLINIFIKYCFKNFIAFLIILACCIPIVKVAYNTVKQQVEEKNQLKLRDGITEIEQNISKMYFATTNMQQDYYVNLLMNKKGELLDKEYLNLGYAREKLVDTSLIYSFPAFSFILFRNNDLFISSSQCSNTFSSYYGNFLEVYDNGLIDASKLKMELFEGDSIYSFKRVDRIKYYSGEKSYIINDAILCTVKVSSKLVFNPSYVMTFVVRPQDLIQMLLTDEIMQEGFVQIKDTYTNDILLQHGRNVEALDQVVDKDQIHYNGSSYRILSYDTKEAEWNISLGIPETIVGNQVKSIANIIILYIFVGILFIIFITLYFSYRQYIDVRKLFVTVSGENSYFGKGINEYDILGGILKDITENRDKYKARLKVIDQQNRALLTESLIVRGINTKEEQREFEKCFEKPLEYFCVVLLKMKVRNSRENQIALLCIIEYLKESYPNDFTNVHTGIHNELFIFSLSPKDASNVLNIKVLFERIINVLTEDMNITFDVGISAIGTDISNINVCYNQAQQVIQAYSSGYGNSVEVYTININTANVNLVGIEFLNKLYNLIIAGEREAIKTQFSKLLRYYQKMPFQYETQKEQIFFSVRNVIYSAYLHLITEAQEKDVIAEYNKHYTIEKLIEVLENSVYKICDHMEKKKKSRNIELKENIIKYIEENFSIPSMTAATVSKKMKISEKYLCNFIKEQTGETFSAHLERIRIQKAKEYLVTKDWSNEKIAGQVGIVAVNTFYRVFRKQTGVSPGIYRNSNKSS